MLWKLRKRDVGKGQKGIRERIEELNVSWERC